MRKEESKTETILKEIEKLETQKRELETEVKKYKKELRKIAEEEKDYSSYTGKCFMCQFNDIRAHDKKEKLRNGTDNVYIKILEQPPNSGKADCVLVTRSTVKLRTLSLFAPLRENTYQSYSLIDSCEEISRDVFDEKLNELEARFHSERHVN